MANLINNFEITNNFTITDDILQVKTNDTGSLDISGNIIIGSSISDNAKLIVKNTNNSIIELKANNSEQIETTKSITNKSGVLEFTSNASLNTCLYEFNVGDNDSVGFMNSNENNKPGIVFGRSGTGSLSVNDYQNAHIFYSTEDGGTINNALNLTGEKLIFNTSSGNFNTLLQAMIIDTSGNVGMGTTPSVSLDVGGVDAIRIPYGTTDDRPQTDASGCIRYNTDNSSYEGFGAGSTWGSLGGVKDVDQDTYISAETKAGDDNDQLKFYTGGSERMIIDSSGNVGIGTSSPYNKLTIDGGIYTNTRETVFNSSTYSNCTVITAGNQLFRNHPTNIPQTILVLKRPGYGGGSAVAPTAVQFKVGQTHSYYGDANTKLDIDLYGGGTVMTLQYNGNVGIGTPSPDYKLEVNGTIGMTGYIYHSGDPNTYFGFPTTDAFVVTTSGTERMKIDSAGNVGIGTTSPTYKLQIKGGGTSAKDCQLMIENENYNKGIEFRYKSSSGTTYDFPQAKIYTSGSSYDTKLHFSTAVGSTNANTVAVEVMTLDSAGNVGIGVTDPDEKLEVAGNIKIGGNIHRTSHINGCLVGSYNSVEANDLKTNPIYCIGSDYLPSANNLTGTGQMHGIGYCGGTAPFIGGNAKGWGMYVAADADARVFLSSGPDNHNYSYIGTSSSSRLGIGTSSPNETLDVNGTIGMTGYIYHSGDTNTYFGFPTTDAFVVTTSGTERMKIDSVGNVGIGTSFPSEKLEVRGVDSTDAKMSIVSTNSTNTNTHKKSGLWFGTCGYPSWGANEWMSRKCAIIADPLNDSNHRTKAKLHFCVNNDTASSSSDTSATISDSRMVIQPDGKVGIGTDSPGEKLEIKEGNIKIIQNFGDDDTIRSMMWHNGVHERTLYVAGETFGSDRHLYIGYTDDSTITNSSYTNGAIITVRAGLDGYQAQTKIDGILRVQNTGTPTVEMYNATGSLYTTEAHVKIRLTYGHGNGRWIRMHYHHNDEFSWSWQANRVGSSVGNWLYFQHRNNIGSSGYRHTSFYIHGTNSKVYFQNGHENSSDRRIKKDIIDVPDDLSLDLLRNIPVRYYNYIEEHLNKESPHQVIGFIAQEVNEVFPIAVTDNEIKVIPSENRMLNNFLLEELIDISSNTIKYKLYTDISCSKGDIYKFHLHENLEDFAKDVLAVCDGGGVFIYTKNNEYAFSKKYRYIFVEGKEINDFHFLDKGKLFALNFSATQEIDKIQQAEKTKLEAAETEINSLKNSNAVLLNKIATLESQYYNLQQQVQTLINNQ